MSQWGFYFNQDRCIGCKACMTSCKNWNDKYRGDRMFNKREEAAIMANPDYIAQEGQSQPVAAFIDDKGKLNNDELGKYHMKEDWRRVETHDTGAINMNNATNTFESNFDRKHVSLGCNHCANPACLEACPMAVFTKEKEHGLVLYDSTSCISCGRCRTACPWSAPQFFDEDYANSGYNDPNGPRMTKCTGCLDRIKEGLKPACVAGCRTRALDFGPLDELRAKYNNNVVEGLPEFDQGHTEPSIIFRAKTNKMS